MKRHEREIHFGTKYNLDFYEGFEPAKFFQCETCEQKFARKTKLKRHIEKNYACSQCGNKFGMKAARDSHIQDAHKENDHACSNCGKGFHRS